MSDKQLPSLGDNSFEGLKQTNTHGAEYWSARDLQPLLGYSQWRRFEQAIERAITSCEKSGNSPGHHFAGAGKMVELGSGSAREVPDYHLSRFACYLIAQNGDPRKPEIAQAQKYFAVQARRQELTDQLAADRERLELRKQTGEEFKALSGAAQQAGVQGGMFGQLYNPNFKSIEFDRFNILAGRSTTPAAPSRIATAGWGVRSGCCRRATNGLTNRGIDCVTPFPEKTTFSLEWRLQ